MVTFKKILENSTKYVVHYFFLNYLFIWQLLVTSKFNLKKKKTLHSILPEYLIILNRVVLKNNESATFSNNVLDESGVTARWERRI